MLGRYDSIFYQALRIRMVEEAIVEIYPSDKIQSPVHLSIGQEHHMAAVMSSLTKEDPVFSSYRCHAVYLAKGGSLDQMFAELYGKKTGVSGGKAGSMHLCAPEVAMYGSSAVVGAVVPHALGMAYSNKIKGNNKVTVSFTGEGSTEEGVFQESLNFASLKSLPLLFFIENNGLAIHAGVSQRQSFKLKELAAAYQIRYFQIENGMDLEGGARLCDDVIQSIRATPHPAIIEVNTYRYLEHVGIRSDFNSGYRNYSECEEWRARDPLLLDLERNNRFKGMIQQEIAQAIRFAEESPFPDQEDLLKDV